MKKTITFEEIMQEMRRMSLYDVTMRTAVQEYEEADSLEKAMMSSQITYLMNQPFFSKMDLSNSLCVAFKVDASIYPVLVNYVAAKNNREESLS